MDLHEQVNIPKLLFLGGLVPTIVAGQHALAKGKVYVESWNIGVPHATLPRWVLRGVTISVGERSMSISECGSRIHLERPQDHSLTG